MKFKLLAAIAIVLALASCKEELLNEDRNTEQSPTDTVQVHNDEDPSVYGKVSGVSFKKMDLAGVDVLTLAPAKTSHPNSIMTRGDDSLSTTPGTDPIISVSDRLLLYKMNDDGTLDEVEYVLTVEGDGELIEMISVNLKLAMEYVFTIGSKWLWLYNCSYYYPDLDNIESTYVRDAILDIIERFGSNNSFLVRISDGALFAWDNVSCPAVGDSRWRTMKWDEETGKEVSKYSISQKKTMADNCLVVLGENIITIIQEEGGLKLYYVIDKGDVLDTKKLLNDNVYYAGKLRTIPGQEAFLFKPSHVDEYVMMFPATAKMALISKNNLQEWEEQKCWNYIRTEDDIVYGLIPLNGGYSYNNKVDIMPGGSDFSIILDGTGEEITLIGNFTWYHCSVTLNSQDTIHLRMYEDYYNLSVNSEDPMCYTLSSLAISGKGTGITLPAGTYDIVFDGQILYIDNVNARTHHVGPMFYLHPLIVDDRAQTASWGDVFFSFCCPYLGITETFNWSLPTDNRLSWAYIFGLHNEQQLYWCGTLGFDGPSFSQRFMELPDYFPSNLSRYIDGYAYVINGTDSFYVCCLETAQSEIVPIVYTNLPSDIVGDIRYSWNKSKMAFTAQVRTLDGSTVDIRVPVTGENRGIAEIDVTESEGAGDSLGLLIRLN